MKNHLRIGLGNTTDKDTVVFHGGITTRDSFGRITDLAIAWCKDIHKINHKSAGEIRVLLQALLEFGFPERNSSTGHLEVAVEAGKMMIALRFQNCIVDTDENSEKELVQYWLNSEETALIKKILHHHDMVEVRFSKELNLIELRIVRQLIEGDMNPHAQTFSVMCDNEKTLPVEHSSYVDMGDLDYEEWISEVYRNPKTGKSGELYRDGESLQREQEWPRLVVERDQRTVENEIKRFESAKNDLISKQELVVPGLADNKSLQKTIITDDERLKEQAKQYELLLIKKEKVNQKQLNDLKVLREKIEAASSNVQAGDAKVAQVFRDKALQMYELVKSLQSDKQKLEKTIFDLKRELVSNSSEEKGVVESNPVPLVVEELNKKVERLSRALEAEKEKVKKLSDRVTVAEKEAQGATPLIEDLESKIETALKSSQQYKKETEAVKQKLVQADAEKNKIKNELIKVQAEIQTLKKRHAS